MDKKEKVYRIRAKIKNLTLSNMEFDAEILVFADCEENARRNAICDTLELKTSRITKIYSCEREYAS